MKIGSRWCKQLVVVALVLATISTSAQSLFHRAFSYEGNMGNLEHISNPNGFLLCSRVRFGTFDEIDGFQFTRFDSTGSIVQTSAFSTGPLSYSMQHGALARSRSDGTYSFLFGGFTALRIFNTSSSGSINWNRMVRYVNQDHLILYIGAMEQAFEETPDGGYLITGLREKSSTAQIDTVSPMVVKLDGAGNVLWNKTYDLDQKVGWHITSHVDTAGELLLGFHADSTWKIISDNCILTRINPNGNTIWSKRVDGFEGRFTSSTLIDGNYIISAMDSASIYILKMDTVGVPIWGKRYALTFPLWTWGAKLIHTLDHGFVLTALMPDSTGGSDVFFFKVDSIGTTQWTRTYGNGNDEWLIDLIENEDTTFTILAASVQFILSQLDSMGMNDCMSAASGLFTESPFPFSMVDVALNELESPMISQPLYASDSTAMVPALSDTCIFSDVVSVSDLIRQEGILIYPNPTSGMTSVRIPEHLRGSNLTIINLFGKRIWNSKLSKTETVLDLSGRPSGVYLYHLVTPDGRTLSGRLIKE